jgi:hypothetical protein
VLPLCEARECKIILIILHSVSPDTPSADSPFGLRKGVEPVIAITLRSPAAAGLIDVILPPTCFAPCHHLSTEDKEAMKGRRMNDLVEIVGYSGID